MVKITKNHFKNYFLTAWKEITIIAVVLFLDLFTKQFISNNMVLGEKVVFIKKFFNFYYCLNTEAAVGFDFWLGDKLGMDGLRIFFIVFVSISTAVFAFFMVRGYKDSFLFRLPLALIIGGALGNLYDRIVHHAVRDFIHFEFFGKKIFGYTYFPTFNLADSALVIGVILFVVYFIFFDAKFQKQKEKLKAEKAAAIAAEDGATGTNAAQAETFSTNEKSVEKSALENKDTIVSEVVPSNNSKSATSLAEEAIAADRASNVEDNTISKEIVENEGKSVEVLDGKRNYTKRIITETVVTETIITETKTTPKKDK